jgi:hypothetical protein
LTSLAKFTSLHSAADIKQKNIDAIKVWQKPFLSFCATGQSWNFLMKNSVQMWRHMIQLTFSDVSKCWFESMLQLLVIDQ